MPSITLSRGFFKKERAEVYKHWPSAFWRELFQNSGDVLARNIDVEMSQLDGFVRVVFADNGPGMTHDTLTNVYFSLGATTKGDAGTVGGFGRARVLTCFSMRRYQIYTNQWIVDGEGAHYELTDAATSFDGCKLIIDIDESSYEELHRSLVGYLAQCQLISKVTINRQDWTEWTYRRNVTKELFMRGTAFAGVHVNRQGVYKNRVLIRVDGTLMFALSTRAKAQVIVEVKRKQSLAILTANRDGLREGYAQALEAFLTDLAVDTNSALTMRHMREESTRLRDGIIRTTRDKSELVTPNGATAMAARTSTSVFIYPNIGIFDQTDLEPVRKAIIRYHPKKWHVGDLAGKRPGHPQTLMEVWRTACEIVVQSYIAITGVPSVSWTVGWYFASAETRSMLVLREGVNFLCLNPVNDDGTPRYPSIAYAADDDTRPEFRMLLASAKHEVAHLLSKVHDEQFASILSDLDERVDPDAALRAMAAATGVFLNDDGMIWYIRDQVRDDGLHEEERVELPNGTMLVSPLTGSDGIHYWYYGVVIAGQIVAVDSGRVYTSVPAFHIAHVEKLIAMGVADDKDRQDKSRAKRVQVRYNEPGGARMKVTPWQRIQKVRTSEVGIRDC